MRTKFLLPNRAKCWGWIITVPALVLMIAMLQFDFSFHFLDYAQKGVQKISFDNGTLFTIQFNNFTDELGTVLLIAGLLLVALSREKDEDERISKIRLESLLWATLVNSLLMMACVLFFYSTLFLKIMAYNICSTLILFVLRFNLVIYWERKNMRKA